jgi:predicted nucleotidyltransferase
MRKNTRKSVTDGIPSDRLSTWTNNGATENPKRAHKWIRNVLQTGRSPLSDELDKHKITLQGSYKNSTTTYGSSDVDVLVRREGAWFKDLSALSDAERELYEQEHSPADYGWEELREDTLTALDTRGIPYTEGRKAIEIDPDDSPHSYGIDLVVCSDFKRFTRYDGPDEDQQEYIQGIAFRTNDIHGRLIINFPDKHYDNGANKNSQTGENYNETVRVFKNARDEAVDRGYIGEDTAPSYFVECLLYNVPDQYYNGGVRERYRGIVDWLLDNKRSLGDFQSQNEVLPLVKDPRRDAWFDERDLWDESDARNFIEGLDTLWSRWDR